MLKITKKEKEQVKAEEPKQPEKKAPVDEINTAIAAALYLYTQEVHDYENYVLTIKRVEKKYSPWSSKIYSLRKWPGGGSF